ncbi:LiaI-LiaF-like domain-containing protein [Camelliibacillus cellulosilyticus]|uniref:LiaI-LiaF-like domain-containing protein n=1 Tax=Camelliibacillus cellulosilyticus TaxID=2174486 RepID=A0ABV9GQ79_9BACL
MKWSIHLSNMVLAAVFIFAGLWFLFDSIGLMDTSLKALFLTFIPYALAIIGLLFLIMPFIRKRDISGDWLFGLCFLSFGGALVCDRWGLFTFHWGDFWKLWPVLIIYVGVMIFVHGRD